MPMIDFICQSADCRTQANLYRPVTSTACPPCPTCGGSTEHDWGQWSHHVRYAVNPVVVFRAADGSFRFPGTPDGLYAKKCETEGMTRLELRGWADVRRFEGEMNTQERSRIARRVERQQEAQAQGESARRSDFHHGLHAGFQMPEMRENSKGEIVPTGRMKHVPMSDRGRAIARLVMERNNGKRIRGYEPNFHIEAYSQDRSNREVSRDEQGRRRRD